MKLGEEARVRLEGFSLEGAARKSLRYTVRKLEKDGVTFEWVPVEGVPARLPVLKTVSDAWLVEKHVAEKRFSLGSFDERYLSHFPISLVRQNDRIVAFANVWPGADKEDYSMKSKWEDRAELFAALFVDKAHPRLREIADADPVVRSKIRFMLRLLGRIDPSMNERYFRKRLGAHWYGLTRGK